MWHRDRKVGLIGLVLVCLAVTGLIMLWRPYQVEEDRYATQTIPRQDQGPIPDLPPIPDPNHRQEKPSRPGKPTEPPKEPTEPPEESTEPSQETGEPQETGQPEDILDTIKGTQTREEWIEAKLEQYRDQIDEADVEDFRSIIGKLDMDHAIALLDNPDGQAGEEALKAYLRKTLTAEEYERAKELFFQYNYILFE